ncbi:MAG TPA: hypothetical protein VF283_15760 [Bryobacteraceae bacterium]
MSAWTLIPLSIGLGVVFLFAFRQFSNQRAIRATRRRVQASLYELRLFVDEPRLVWRAQGTLLWVNLRYLALMLVPALILCVPVALLIAFLDPYYAKAPLVTGQPTIVTAKLHHSLSAASTDPILQAPPGFAVETPGVRIPVKHEISWRIRPLRATSGTLRIVLPTQIVTKDVTAGSGRHFLSTRRARSFWQLFWHPTESRLPRGDLAWIDIRYPSRSIHWLGFGLNWIVWLFIISMITALVLKRPLRVSF